MANRIPPKGYKVKSIYIGDVEVLDDCTLTSLISFFSSVDTQGLLDPVVSFDMFSDEDFGYSNGSMYLVGFEPKTDKELERDRMVAKTRREAAEKRKATLANKEKEQLRKLASKYPEVINNTSTTLL